MLHRSDKVRYLLSLVPGKRRLGIYRFLPVFFCIGGVMEWIMINVRIGQETFYDVYRRKKSERQYQAMIADDLIDLKEPASKWEAGLNLVWTMWEHQQDITDGLILCTKRTSKSAVGWIFWGLCVRHLQTHSWSTTSTSIAKRLCQCHWLWRVNSSFITAKNVIKENVKSRFQYAGFIVSRILSLRNRVGVKLLVVMLKNAKNLSH